MARSGHRSVPCLVRFSVSHAAGYARRLPDRNHTAPGRTWLKSKKDPRADALTKNDGSLFGQLSRLLD
jgi:hypothetical protein